MSGREMPPEMNPVATPLHRLIAEAAVLAGGEHPCAVLGHKWQSIGGRHCGCEDEDGRSMSGCSVPVQECAACGDCDYGDNGEAAEIIAACRDDAA